MLKTAPRRWALTVVLLPCRSQRIGLFARQPIPVPETSTAPAPPARRYLPRQAPLTPPTSRSAAPPRHFHDSVAGRYNYAFGKESPFLPSNAMSVNGQFLSPNSFLHRAILRPLPPGGLPPVAAVGSFQRLPQSLVSQERQHAHRREGGPVLAPLRGMPQSRRAPLRRPFAGHAQETPIRGRRHHLLHLPLHPVNRHNRYRQLRHGYSRGNRR